MVGSGRWHEYILDEGRWRLWDDIEPKLGDHVTERPRYGVAKPAWALGVVEVLERVSAEGAHEGFA